MKKNVRASGSNSAYRAIFEWQVP